MLQHCILTEKNKTKFRVEVNEYRFNTKKEAKEFEKTLPNGTRHQYYTSEIRA